MTISNKSQAFVWVWLPKWVTPVVAGKVHFMKGKYHFTYGRSYLEREDSISLSPIELPLQRGTFEPEGLNEIHSCLRDAAPDAWGRRVIGYQYPTFIPNELDYLLLSGTHRIGALDFQQSGIHYEARDYSLPQLQDLLQAALLIEARKPLPPELDYALLHGTSVGGARPKALITNNKIQYIAKFSSSTDYYDVVKAEYVAMALAKIAGIEVADVQLEQSLGKDILLVKRFDRINHEDFFERCLMLSGLSLLKLNEMEARYASYQKLAELIRHQFSHPLKSLHEIFKRIVFNILMGNTDDHARNHAAFWDGTALTLTPAYDICPQNRTGQIATQAMNLEGKQGNHATLVNALSICRDYRLEEIEAKDIINTLIAVIRDHWLTVCHQADLSKIERERWWQNAVFNPYCFEGWKIKE
jgi:serine/threonine-protein kinase HipA